MNIIANFSSLKYVARLSFDKVMKITPCEKAHHIHSIRTILSNKVVTNTVQDISLLRENFAEFGDFYQIAKLYLPYSFANLATIISILILSLNYIIYTSLIFTFCQTFVLCGKL